MDDFVPVGFRDLHRANEDVPCECVDRFVALDAAEAGIFISLISKRLADKCPVSCDKTMQVIFDFKTVDIRVLVGDRLDCFDGQECESVLPFLCILDPVGPFSMKVLQPNVSANFGRFEIHCV